MEHTEDSATEGGATSEDLDYGLQGVGKSVAPDTDADDKDPFDGPTAPESEHVESGSAQVLSRPSPELAVQVST